MAKIPEQHKKYNLLRKSATRDDWECFCYPNLSKLERIGIYGLDPYGYSSVEEYNQMISEKIKEMADETIINLLELLQIKMIRLNCKENWSVLRYIGEDLGDGPSLIQGKCYYWPCDINNPIYDGVIDEEEYTSYWYPTEPELWEILEDPTGMAYETIYGKKNYVSQVEWNYVLNQFKTSNGKE